MAIHTVYAVASLGKNQLVNSSVTNLAFETMRVVRVVSCHDGLIENGKVANITAVRAICTDRGSIGKQEEVRVGVDLIAAFGALEAVNMKEGLAKI